ncbi:MAG: PIN domain-containing protein [Elusimicrobia bacterium]|nr:PIN domain-containing protein [Elusimicrobiota bacterium]
MSYALRGAGRVSERLLEHRPSQLCISSISFAELRFGAELRQSQRLERLIDAFAATMDVSPFDSKAADQFGTVAAALRRRGAPIGHMDALIAAHALALGLTLVTNNTRHFDQVSGLRTENWF